MSEINGKIEEINASYKTAKTAEDYKKVEEKGKELWQICQKEYYNNLANGLNYLWATYYRLLKFSPENREDFSDEVRNLLYRIADLSRFVADPEKKIELLYLESVVHSYITENIAYAEALNKQMLAEISEGDLSLSSILRLINSIGLKEMSEKNWAGAVKVLVEISNIPPKDLGAVKNPDLIANVFSNLGASYIRGNIDIEEGERCLLIAEGYYLKTNPPSEKHLQGIKNRLREAKGKRTAIRIIQDLSGRSGWSSIWSNIEEHPEIKREITEKWEGIAKEGLNPNSVINQILTDLINRYGLQQEWEATDKQTQEEIKEKWKKIVSENN
ncbi:MAG: hypothetical protein WC178_01535 [Candidatus Paceibacterota bacterium]